MKFYHFLLIVSVDPENELSDPVIQAAYHQMSRLEVNGFCLHSYFKIESTLNRR